MSAIPKKKLCWHCEGSIDRQLDNCPYCGVYVHNPEDEETFAWNPPFNLKILSKEQEDPENSENSVAEEKVEAAELPENITTDQIKTTILPLIFLLMGSSFLLFGIVLLLFSHEGSLTLKWNGDNWIYFLLVSIPSILYGWYLLKDEE